MMRISVSQPVSGTVRSLSHPVQSMSHACIVQESWDHVIPASLSVCKTLHLSALPEAELIMYPDVGSVYAVLCLLGRIRVI
jgi:hypothetical protein